MLPVSHTNLPASDSPLASPAAAFSRLPWLRLASRIFLPRCWDCGKWLNMPDSAEHFFCHTCFHNLPWQIQAPPFSQQLSLDGIWSGFLYQSPLQNWLWNLKYYRQDHLAPLLGWLLAQASVPSQSFDPQLFDWVIPVPLHPRRTAWRGFNQSELLATHWQRNLKLKNPPQINKHLLQRIRFTTPQMQLSLAQRKKNMQNAFAPTTPTPKLQGKKLLLLDDVFTSGNTLGACAAVLKSLGAETVWGLTLSWRP